MRIQRRLVTTLAGVVLAVATFTCTPSAFADSNDTVTTSEISSALDRADSRDNALVAEAAPAKSDSDSAAVVQQGEGVTDVPKSPDEGISFKTGSRFLTVELPNADDANSAQRTGDGVVAYPASDGSASAVVPTDTGVQVLTAIANANAPTRYDYKITVPEGGRVVADDDGGGAMVFDASDQVIMAVPSPWAKDYKGYSVPSHFETDGKSLTQVVDHTNGNYTYPIVADPIMIIVMFKVAKCFVGGSLAFALSRGAPMWLRIAGTVYACVF